MEGGGRGEGISLKQRGAPRVLCVIVAIPRTFYEPDFPPNLYSFSRSLAQQPCV